MPTLFPPLDAEGDGDSVLPADLKANFEALQAIIRAQSRLEKEEELISAAESFDDLKDFGCKSEKEQASVEGDTVTEVKDVSVGNSESETGRLETRKRKLAMATAVAVQSEISRLTNGIAELETLLLQQGDGDAAPEVHFPSLPIVVADEDSEEREEDKGESSSDEVNESKTTQEEMDLVKEGEK